jgi:hypothetical protein
MCSFINYNFIDIEYMSRSLVMFANSNKMLGEIIIKSESKYYLIDEGYCY